MSPTRHLRSATAPLDDATLAAAVAIIIGPPGLVRYPPRSPALFPPPRPLRRTVRRTAPVVGAGLALAGLLVALWPGGSYSAVGMVALPPATVPAPATVGVSATLPAPTTLVAPTVVAPLPTATVALPLAEPVRTVLPTLPLPTATVRPVPPTAIPPRLPPPPATATMRPVVRLPVPVPTAAPVVLPPVTPGSGPAGGDWSASIYTRSATIHADPTP